MIRIAGLLSAILVILLAWSSSANLITFSTRTEWESAVGQFDTETFDSTPSQRQPCSEQLPFGGCAQSFAFQTSKLYIVIPVGADFVHEIATHDYLTVNGSQAFYSDLHGQILVAGISFNTIVFPNPITAFSVDLANVYDDCEVFGWCPPVQYPLTVSLGGVDTALFHGSTFFGATSDVAFSSVVIRNTNPYVGLVVRPVLDNISFVVVPEPGTAYLIGLGLVPLALRRRNRTA